MRGTFVLPCCDPTVGRSGGALMIGCFAIIPDGDQQPSALFKDLEAAMDWAVETYGCDALRIRWLEVAPIERAEARGASGPA